jgi:hypothetical protein
MCPHRVPRESIASVREKRLPPANVEFLGTAGLIRNRTVIPVAIISLLAVWLVMVATHHGIGVSPDSTQYLYAAESFARGDGLRTHWWEEGSQPLTHFPPGFPVALATVGRLVPDLSTAATIINALALVATAFLTFSLTKRATNGSSGAAIAATAAVLMARDILEAHAMVWTEPLFLALSLATLALTVRAIDQDDTASLIGAALVAGLAATVRYAAPALIGASALSLLIMGQRPWKARLLRAVTFGIIASLPLVLILAANARVAGAATNRDVVFHPITLGTLRVAARTAYYWLVPLGAPIMVDVAIVCAAAVTVAVWVVSMVRHRARATVVATDRPTTLVLGVFTLGYAAFLMFTLFFVDAQSTPGPRLLLPLLPTLIILIVAALTASMRVNELRRAAIAVSLVVGLAMVMSTAYWVVRARTNGLGYRSVVWARSPLMARVRELDRETLVLSNHPGAILLLAGREAVGIPRLANPNTLAPNADFSREMADLCRAAAGGRRVAYAHFTLDDDEATLPTLDEVRRRWSSAPAYTAADGVLEVLPATPAPACLGRG